MKSSFDKHSKPQEVINFIGQTFANAKGYQDALETISLSLLPLLREARAEGRFDTHVRNIPMLYDMVMSDPDFDEWSQIVTSVPRQTVFDALSGTSLGQVQTPEERLKQAARIKEHILSLSEEDYIALSIALDSILPPGLRAASNAMDGSLDPAESAREIRRLAASLSAEDIAEVMAERDARLNPDRLADGVHDLLQQCTPERLEKLVNHLNDNLGGAAVGLLVKRFWDFSEELLQAADNGNFMALQNPAKGKTFARTLCETLTALEEGLQHAGFTMPEDVSQFMAESLNTRRILLTAGANVEAHKGLADGITVNRPLKLKKPGFTP